MWVTSKEMNIEYSELLTFVQDICETSSFSFVKRLVDVHQASRLHCQKYECSDINCICVYEYDLQQNTHFI
jgi:hypothetical protein